MKITKPPERIQLKYLLIREQTAFWIVVQDGISLLKPWEIAVL